VRIEVVVEIIVIVKVVEFVFVEYMKNKVMAKNKEEILVVFAVVTVVVVVVVVMAVVAIVIIRLKQGERKVGED
jgi:hypothetical protein